MAICLSWYLYLVNVTLFAEEIAEILSTDMQKEALFGRTLTLKLKTAAFEVHIIIFTSKVWSSTLAYTLLLLSSEPTLIALLCILYWYVIQTVNFADYLWSTG